MKNLLLICISLCCIQTVSAREETSKHFLSGLNYGWCPVDKDISMSSVEIMDQLRFHFELGIENEFVLLNAWVDELGNSHKKYQQTHEGNKVHGAVILTHEENGRVYLINGSFGKNFQSVDAQLLTENSLIDFAKEYASCDDYVFDNLDELDSKIAEKLKLQPKTELVFFPLDTQMKQGNVVREYKLLARVKIRCQSLDKSEEVFLDPISGKIEKAFPLSLSCNSTQGEFFSFFNGGNQHINNLWDPYISKYKLIDDCRGLGIRTLTGNGAYSSDIIGLTDYWNHFPDEYRGAHIHWATTTFYDYLLSTFSWDSYDDESSEMRAYLDYSHAARYDKYFESIFIGPSSEANDILMTLDIVGHEWGHAVVHQTADLSLYAESNGLNESFADIFGTLNEFYAENLYDPNKNGDWLLGEDVWILDGKLRDMEDPHSKDDPDTYEGTYWNVSSIHGMGGVQNHWFYLLSEGGMDQNDHPTFQYQYDVQGIGMDQAASIMFRALTTYLTSSSQFLDSRFASIQAANDIFGDCSFETKMVIEAWNAVGVYVPDDYEGEVVICPDLRHGKYSFHEDREIEIYPNPTTFEFSIKCHPNDTIHGFSLRDFHGSEHPLRAQQTGNSLKFYPERRITPGVYFLELELDGRVLVKKVVFN